MASSNDMATRAAVGFALVVGIAIGTTLAATRLVRGSAARHERILLQYADDLTYAWQVQAAAERMVASGRGYLLTSDGDMLARVKDSEALLDSALAALERPDASPAKRELVGAVERAADSYRRQFAALVETTPSTEDRQSLAQALRQRLLPSRDALDGDIKMLMAHERRTQEDTSRRAALVAGRATAAMLVLGGAAMAMSAVLAWIFTRRLGEIQRRERQSARRAEQALSTKEELLRIVAHDLRSPLGAILLRASTLGRSSADEQARASARSIMAICERMAGLIESLVEAANVESGRLSLTVQRFAVGELIRAAIDTFTPAAADKSIHMEGAVTPADLELTADRERLLQVISNLLGNALKFTPAGGVVGVGAKVRGGQVRFEVRDTGPGIAPENHGHVFERYWGSDRQGGGGIGLGLYIAKGIVDAHGGRIWVESAPGRGAGFFFEIPSEPRWIVSVANEESTPGDIRTEDGRSRQWH
jgi:signal transduction histidine kinase